MHTAVHTEKVYSSSVDGGRSSLLLQVKKGLQWLAGPRQEYLRLAGVLVLQELAENAPAVFNVHVRSFIEVIWNPLRDPKQHIREAAVAALRACLMLVEKRETRYRVQWYYRLFEETQRGLTRVTSLETVHGSLLALGELLRHTGLCGPAACMPGGFDWSTSSRATSTRFHS